MENSGLFLRSEKKCVTMIFGTISLSCMEEQKTTFLNTEKTGGNVNPGNIFQELQDELTAVE